MTLHYKPWWLPKNIAISTPILMVQAGHLQLAPRALSHYGRNGGDGDCHGHRDGYVNVWLITQKYSSMVTVSTVEKMYDIVLLFILQFGGDYVTNHLF